MFLSQERIIGTPS